MSISIKKLTDAQLTDAYSKAVKHRLDHDFLILLEFELDRRQLEKQELTGASGCSSIV